MERVCSPAVPNANPAGTITRAGPMVCRQMLLIDYQATYDEVHTCGIDLAHALILLNSRPIPDPLYC